MNSSGKKISDYINWIIKNYEEARDYISQASHRIVGYEKNEVGRHEVLIQLIGKNVTFKIFPEDILADDSMTELFSKKDIRNLTYLACENLKEPKQLIVGQKFKRKANKFFFKLKHGKTGEEIEKSAEEISVDEDLINSMHPRDAHVIGFVTANEQIKKEH